MKTNTLLCLLFASEITTWILFGFGMWLHCWWSVVLVPANFVVMRLGFRKVRKLCEEQLLADRELEDLQAEADEVLSIRRRRFR